ncbi:MAG: tetratricopeptide repeat protein [Bryobacterales bacterium]|nr:tetratricopeptide repeat protein [Bryobacterales bacterium]
MLILVAMTMGTGRAAIAPGEEELEAAIHREVVMGDLQGAMRAYERIAAGRGVSRATVARAYYQLGQCLEKSGRRAEARATYERVAKEFDERSAGAVLARARLANWDHSIPGPLNLRFDQGVEGKLPAAWFVPALPNEADQWAQIRRGGCRSARSCAVVLIPENAPVPVGNLMQSFSARAYRGKRVRLRAWLRLEAADGGDKAQMWLGVDRAKEQKGFFDNMSDRPVRSAEWTQCEIVTRVEDDATVLKFGVMSIGKGRVWVDDVTFETIR